MFEFLFGKLQPIEKLAKELRDRRGSNRDELDVFLDRAFKIQEARQDPPLFVYDPLPDCRYGNEEIYQGNP